jgi:hypothetical protein
MQENKVLATLLVDRPYLLTRGCGPDADAGTDITAECTSPTTTPVQLDGTGSSDSGGESLTYAWSAAGVTFDDATLAEPTGGFLDGTTTVQLVVFNGTYNDTDYVDVTIEDTTPPMITCPTNIEVECMGNCGTGSDDADLSAFFDGVSASDICDDDVEITHDAPGCLGLGETTVMFTAKDDAGNTASCSATVTVVDTTPPTIDVVLSRDVLWPPNHKMVDVCAYVTVEDLCDPEPSWVLYSYESNEPDNDRSDGNTIGDIEAHTTTQDPCHLSLRSERQGLGEGRKYTLIYRAADHSGNLAYDTVCVTVPHNQSAAAMSATGFTATGTAFENGTRSFAVVIPGTEAIDVKALDLDRVYLGNTAGVLTTRATQLVDVNKDCRQDLAMTY